MLRVALCILCYNYGRYLAQAIESCLQLTESQCKVTTWVFDDGSTDNTAEICASYRDRVRVSRSENLGFGATLTRAVEEPDADYVCLLDADDWFHPQKLAVVAREMARGRDFIQHGMDVVDAAGHRIEGVSLPGSTSSMCLKRNSAITLLPATTEVSFLSLFHGGDSILLRDRLTYYRRHGASMQDNPIPGSWYGKLARIYGYESERQNLLLKDMPCWVRHPARLQHFAEELRCHAHFSELEASLQLGHRLPAFRALACLVAAEYRLNRTFSLSHVKFAIRVALAKPHFPIARSV